MSKLQYQHWKHVLQSSCCSLYSPCKGNFSSQVHCHMVHCKDTIPKIWNKYSQERNCAASVPSSTSMCLWAIYVFPGRAMPFLGIHKWDFCCSVSILFFLHLEQSSSPRSLSPPPQKDTWKKEGRCLLFFSSLPSSLLCRNNWAKLPFMLFVLWKLVDQLLELFVCITHVENGMHLEDRGGGGGGGEAIIRDPCVINWLRGKCFSTLWSRKEYITQSVERKKGFFVWKWCESPTMLG
jgi:hypothetical protein